MHLFHPYRTSSHPTLILSLQTNEIALASLFPNGKVELNNETIVVCSRNGHILWAGDTKTEFADGSVGSQIGSPRQLHGTKRSMNIIERSSVVFSCLAMVKGRNRAMKWVTSVCNR